MTIDIRGVSLGNKGAHLMLLGITQRLGGRVDLAMPPHSGPYPVRARLGLYQTAHDYRRPRAFTIAADRVPSGMARRFGVVRNRDVSGVLDASGFAYSDSFTLRRIEREAWFAERWQAAGVPRVLLPQAIGPLEDPDRRAAASRLLSTAALVYARDDVSARFVEELGADVALRRSPDLTIPMAPRATPPAVDSPHGLIVPNLKLVSSGTASARDYHATLEAYAHSLRGAGLVPAILVHETSDSDFATALGESASCAVVRHDDPLVLKGLLGGASVVVASRFHAVVSALSQGVPTLALGWSHKYKELLRDFGVVQWLVGLDHPPADALRMLLDDAAGTAGLPAAKAHLTGQVEAMWASTEHVLGLGASGS